MPPEGSTRRSRRLADSQRSYRYRQNASVAMHRFAVKNDLTCFKCGSSATTLSPSQIAKTGISDRGRWMICLDCVKDKPS